jgi:hypothetical protein
MPNAAWWAKVARERPGGEAMVDELKTLAENIKTLTWADIEREALHCPVLHHMRHLDAMDNLTREQVMIFTLLWFSRTRRQAIDLETKRLMNQAAPVRPVDR